MAKAGRISNDDKLLIQACLKSQLTVEFIADKTNRTVRTIENYIESLKKQLLKGKVTDDDLTRVLFPDASTAKTDKPTSLDKLEAKNTALRSELNRMKNAQKKNKITNRAGLVNKTGGKKNPGVSIMTGGASQKIDDAGLPKKSSQSRSSRGAIHKIDPTVDE